MKYVKKDIFVADKDYEVGQLCSLLGANETELKRQNYIVDSKIYCGDAIVVPETHYLYYIVKPNDTLESIAKKHNLSVDFIKQKNGIVHSIFIGQKIFFD